METKAIDKLSAPKVKELASDSPDTGLVEVRLIDPKRSGTITVRGYNTKQGEYRPFVDRYGQERVLRVQRTLYLNMGELNDRLTYAQIKNHPIYIDGPRPVLKIVNFEDEASSFVKLKDLEAEANAIIHKLEGDELKDFARILLVVAKDGSSDKVIKRTLYEKSALNPGEIINEWNDSSRELKAILRKGLEKNVFESKFGRFTFKGELMGTTFESSVDWLKQNEDLVPNLRKEIG